MLRFRKGQLDVLCGSKMVIEGLAEVALDLRPHEFAMDVIGTGLDLPGVGMIIVVDANSPGFLRTVWRPSWGLYTCAILCAICQVA